MSAASIAIGRKANNGPARLCGNARLSVRSIRFLDSVMRKLRDLYPSKTAANIAVRAGVETRAAEWWLARERDMNSESFIRLLVTDDGDKILEAIMNALPQRERPRWWLRHCNMARIARLESGLVEYEEQMRLLRLEMSR